MHEFATGVRDVGRGLAALRAHPALWKWVVAPAAITLVLLVAAVVGIAHAADPAVGWAAAHLPGPLARIAGGVLTVLIIGGLAIAGLLVFTSVAGAVAGPFNEQLSEHLESALTGRPTAAFSLHAFVRGAAASVVHALRRLLAALAGIVLVFAVGLVPVVGTVAALGVAAWFAGTAAAYDCYDAVFGRRAMSYRDKQVYLARHRGRTLGLGLAVAGLLLVPGLNLLALAIGSAGATVADHARQHRADRYS
ncbi:MAG TPA: EI24 domain-containing protein [Kofleriaceae bacterium]|nr:EI24 domain-containing protein [Kofleriaceae bacterium]